MLHAKIFIYRVNHAASSLQIAQKFISFSCELEAKHLPQFEHVSIQIHEFQPFDRYGQIWNLANG